MYYVNPIKEKMEQINRNINQTRTATSMYLCMTEIGMPDFINTCIYSNYTKQ